MRTATTPRETRFRHDAAVRAHAILEGEDAAILAGIRMAFADRVAWRIPHGRTLRLSWSSAASDLARSCAGGPGPMTRHPKPDVAQVITDLILEKIAAGHRLLAQALDLRFL